MTNDFPQFLPRDKHDTAAVRAIVALGYPAVRSLLPDLLAWLQDCNWPVSHPIGDFLTTISDPMAPLIRDVLNGDDDVWKYWCIVRLVAAMPGHVAEQFRSELHRLADQPTATERAEDLDEVARDAMRSLWSVGGD